MATISKINGKSIGALINYDTVPNQTIEGGAGAIGTAYYLTTTDDTWQESDQTNEVTVSGVVGICSAANSIMFSGLVTSLSHGLGSLGSALYVSTSGSLTSTIPSVDGVFSKRVGYIEDADSIRVLIDPNYYEIGELSITSDITATQAEAEAGVINNKYMTPLRTAQAIDAQVKTRYTHGTVSSGIESFSAFYTHHTITSSGSHTWDFSNFTESNPDMSVKLTVLGGTPTITLPEEATILVDSAKTLSTIASGTYLVEAVSFDTGASYEILVGQVS